MKKVQDIFSMQSFNFIGESDKQKNMYYATSNLLVENFGYFNLSSF